MSGEAVESAAAGHQEEDETRAGAAGDSTAAADVPGTAPGDSGGRQQDGTGLVRGPTHHTSNTL
jgi:hypothetical protein